MKHKIISCILVLVFLCAALSGCTPVTTNQEKNMEQVVATVDIADEKDFATSEYADYAAFLGEYSEKAGYVLKRDLVAYFLNEGYNYVQSYGYSYAETYELMMESLVNRKIMVQYAMAYFLNTDAYSIEGLNAAIANLGSDYSNYEYTIAALSYFLPVEDVEEAKYTLRKMINVSLDNIEKNYYIEKDETEYASDVRTLPTGVDTENEDFYDVNYTIYTGRNAIPENSTYEKQKGSTPTTRKKAYNYFLNNLKSNALLSDGEDSRDFEDLGYWDVEFASQLEQSMIEKLTDCYEDEAVSKMTKSYVLERYTEILKGQKEDYDASPSAFETAIGSVSDTSFVMYSPTQGFGFVYNILLPFSTTQSNMLTVYENNKGMSKDEYYYKRAELLRNLTATDQRETWFTGATDYSFKVSEDTLVYGNGEYLFFEDNVVNGGSTARYEKLANYKGAYAYNGKVTYTEEDGYKFTPNKLTIDGFIDEMIGYTEFAVGTAAPHTLLLDNSANYYTREYYNNIQPNGVLDAKRFIYKAGRFAMDFNANTMFMESSVSNQVMSVINELMFAYNTDTAGLNTYLGYTVSAYDTSYVSEFEYAAKYAVSNGVGTYAVVPSTYGWHVIYCTFAYGSGEVYSFDWSEIETEGSFSQKFYEALKDSDSGSLTAMRESEIVNKYSNDECVATYPSRYKDLIILGESQS